MKQTQYRNTMRLVAVFFFYILQNFTTLTRKIWACNFYKGCLLWTNGVSWSKTNQFHTPCFPSESCSLRLIHITSGSDCTKPGTSIWLPVPPRGLGWTITYIATMVQTPISILLLIIPYHYNYPMLRLNQDCWVRI